MNDANTLNLRVVRGLWVVGLAVQKNLAGIRLIYAGEKLDEGGLSGAVLAEDDVCLTALQFQRDTVQRNHTRKGLADIFQS